MLTRFEVTNFKSFKDKFVFDFTNTSDYQFNSECVKNGVVNKGMIYGANGSGKSNLGLAIFDIVSHLTEKEFRHSLYQNYLNAENLADLAEFSYFFTFEGQQTSYCYGKSDVNTLIYEELKINNEVVLSIDRRNSNIASINLTGAENLNRDIGGSKISVLNYIKNNTVRPVNTVNKSFDDLVAFVEKMLLFKSLLDGVFFIGSEKGSHRLLPDIIAHNNVSDFQDFLNQAGVECQLEVSEYIGEPSLSFVFGKKKIHFWDIASTGTQSLTLLYFWLQRLKEKEQISFVFIDEFDAFYHHDLSELVVKELKKIDAQVILTTHNTSIMTNDLLRPDCYFLMNKEVIKPLNKCTEKELRFAHNIEKIYRADGFHV
jgi:AAA15 family ATPase/GTPase